MMVIGSAVSTSVRWMRDPVTVMRSNVFTLLSLLLSLGSACCAMTGMVKAANSAMLRRRIWSVVREDIAIPQWCV